MKPKLKLVDWFPILAGVLYGVSPIDLIPDMIPLIGYLDDAIAIPLLFLLGFLKIRRRLKSRPSLAKVKS